MVTVVPKTIQAAGGDYATYALANSALPSSLVTADEQWSFKGDGTFSFSTGISTTVTTDATRFIDVDCQTSKGFASAAAPVGRWDSSKGLNLVCTGYSQPAWTVSTHTFKLHNHQIAQTGGGNRRAFTYTASGSSNSLIESCIFESGDDGPGTRYGTIRNCLSIVRGAGGNGWNFDYYVGGSVAGVTVARPTDWSAAGTGFSSVNAITMKDCVCVGFSTVTGGGGAFSGNNNGTDQAAMGFGTSNQVSVARSTATFVGVTDAARDFRIVTGSALKDTGATDTTTIPAAVDAFGTSRPSGSAWDIGFHEFVAAGGAPQNITLTLATLKFVGFPLGVNSKSQFPITLGTLKFNGFALGANARSQFSVSQALLKFAGFPLNINVGQVLSVVLGTLKFVGFVPGVNAKRSIVMTMAPLIFFGSALSVTGAISLVLTLATLRFVGQAIAFLGQGGITRFLSLLGVGR